MAAEKISLQAQIRLARAQLRGKVSKDDVKAIKQYFTELEKLHSEFSEGSPKKKEVEATMSQFQQLLKRFKEEFILDKEGFYMTKDGRYR